MFIVMNGPVLNVCQSDVGECGIYVGCGQSGSLRRPALPLCGLAFSVFIDEKPGPLIISHFYPVL